MDVSYFSNNLTTNGFKLSFWGSSTIFACYYKCLWYIDFYVVKSINIVYIQKSKDVKKIDRHIKTRIPQGK